MSLSSDRDSTSGSAQKRKAQTTLDQFSVSKRTKTDNNSDISSSSSSSSSPAMNPATLQSDALRKKNAAQAPKKMVIKPFKVKPQLPENFEEETWNRLRSAVVAIFQRQPVTASLEELYRAVEDMCLHKMAPSLYSKLQEESQVHIKGKVEALLGAGDDLELFLQVVDRTWNDLCAQLITVRSVFLYLDRTYVLQTASLKSLWDAGLAQFKEHLSVYPELQRKTVEGLLVLIEKERMGEAVDRTLIKSLVRMLTSLALYSAGFEPPFLEATDKFYAAEGARLMQEIEVSEYLKHVENRLQQEQDRVNNYLDRNTRRPLLLALERQLLAVHVSAILEKSGPLFDQCRLPDLSRLFSLLSRVSALDQLKASWAAYLKRTGLSLVQDEERDKSLVEDLLALKARADSILEQAFQKNENFTFALKDAFESFVNSRQNKPAELIAKFIDEKLKTGFKGSSEEELEQLLDKVLVIFRYITEKDVFEAFYKKDLAKRLLLAKSASFDTEKSMIAKLKAECGSGFTSKLEGMFKDIDLSKDIMAAFEQRLKEPTDSTSPSSSSTPSTTPSSSSPSSSSSSSSSSSAVSLVSSCAPDMDLQVHVLTAGYWPNYPPAELNLPPDMASHLEAFKTFYLSKHQGRRLTFQHSLGHCLVKANFPQGRKELSVSLFQTAVLLLFNNAVELSFSDIKAATNMEDGELRRTLQSLACAKIQVLRKKPKGREVEDSDTFEVASDFNHKLVRIKINQIQIKETKEERDETTEKVVQDRQYQIDAACVRIMKTRKTITHTQLIAELFSQLRFPAKASDLKKRIESLIEREYLERDKDNAQIYHYLA